MEQNYATQSEGRVGSDSDTFLEYVSKEQRGKHPMSYQKSVIAHPNSVAD